MNAFVPAVLLVENWRAEITAGTALSGAKDFSHGLSFFVKTFQCCQYLTEEEKWG